MAKWEKLAHVVYQCSNHIIWTPQYRCRILEGDIAKAMEAKIRRYVKYKEEKELTEEKNSNENDLF